MAGGSACGQARAFAGKTVTNLRPPCGHVIRADAAAQAQTVAPSAARRQCADALGLPGKGGAAENRIGGEWPRSPTEEWMSKARTPYPTRLLRTREAEALLGSTSAHCVATCPRVCLAVAGSPVATTAYQRRRFTSSGAEAMLPTWVVVDGSRGLNDRRSTPRVRRARRAPCVLVACAWAIRTPVPFYDLSPEALAALRAQVEVSDG
jgi:hypothetical protein